MKKRILAILMLLTMIISLDSMKVYAEEMTGKVIISLGANLSEERKQAILDEFNVPEDAEIIYTTNEEEHEYLGGIIPKKQSGSNAISSVMITYTEKGSGLNVQTSDKITYITKEYYTNALITAGVEDADIKITAPVAASGTAALTGILKAHEISTGEVIDEDVKKVANEEMVTTAQLGEEIGVEEATELINKIKQEIADKNPQTKEEVRNIIINVINNLNINLSDELIEKLVNLFDKMKDLDINWSEVTSQIEKFASKAKDYLSSEEGQGFLQKLKVFFNKLIDWIASLFK